MRKKYKELDFEIVKFDTEDVITTSPAGNDDGGEEGEEDI